MLSVSKVSRKDYQLWARWILLTLPSLTSDKNGISIIPAKREKGTTKILEVQDIQKEVNVDHLSGYQGDAVNTKDRSFIGARQDQIPNNGCKSDLYVKQEELVLKIFRNCLRKIITLGDLKGKILHLTILAEQLPLHNSQTWKSHKSS